MTFSKKVLAILAVPILLVSVALFVKLNTNNVMVINTCNEHSYSDSKIIKSSTGPNTNIGFNINMRSSSSEIQSFKFLERFIFIPQPASHHPDEQLVGLGLKLGLNIIYMPNGFKLCYTVLSYKRCRNRNWS